MLLRTSLIFLFLVTILIRSAHITKTKHIVLYAIDVKILEDYL